ncbi:MAG: UDP-N-acetylglucosamine 2-epimerase (non-hydrolyzing) [Bacteroidetes bacterium]|nr:UDP-N-acetylglucosamine 2-epimerase (non-hydrolyzing) [Bacteroidota bacterium]
MAIKKILVVVGTRPNFIKVTQFKRVAGLYPDVDLKIVHTGQHFDSRMADVFFTQFNLVPDFFLNINTSVSPNKQIAEIMVKLEDLILTEFKPDLLMVVGDVNSTLAAAITGNKLNIKLAHVESGLRSFDKTMPEEHNRIVTDAITDYFLVTEQSGWDNLKKEGVSENRLFFTGNTMIDTMVAFSEQIENSDILTRLQLKPKAYVLMTMHRPASVDHETGLKNLLRLIQHISQKQSVVFPVHPRTLKNMEVLGLKASFEAINNLIFTDPLDYFAFQKLTKYSKFILTDSGGIQEESTFLQVPCLTLRENTERPVTCQVGSNTLVPFDIETIITYTNAIENGTYKKGEIPALWDGKATERIFEYLVPLI